MRKIIYNRKDLQYFISEDRRANLGDCSRIKAVLKLILGTSDGVMAFLYLKSLRRYEYAINNNHNTFGSLFRLTWCRLINNFRAKKYNIVIYPNTVGPGLRLPHIIGGAS